MGVGRENKDIFFSPYVPENEMQILENQSGQSTDEEDLHPPIGTGNRSSHRNRRSARPRSSSVEACLTGMYRRCGAKQARRTENIKYLLNLKVDGEEEDSARTPSYNSNTSAFAELLQEREKMQAWNNFVNSSEEDQQRILHMRRSDAALTSIQEESSDDGGDDNGNQSLDDSWEKVMTTNCDGRTVHPCFSAEECFERVDKNLRSMLTRRHLPLGMVAQLEKEVVDFFNDCPGSVYVSHLASSFERLLLHAVCQFLGLHCHSYDENGQRRTQVENRRSSFFLPSETLADYLERIS
ncbi:R3H domain-containing protein 4-like [Littorina saxatilis]|uniref:R3H domain-containing protein n=1 Tax=Littorina saxatilis TaxID=31220 RepID=A0AAN9G9A4_9CAEN